MLPSMVGELPSPKSLSVFMLPKSSRFQINLPSME